MTAHYARCGHEVTPEPGPIKSTCGVCPPIEVRRHGLRRGVVPAELAAELCAAQGARLNLLLMSAADDGWSMVALAAVLGVSPQSTGQRVIRARTARRMAGASS
jgi:hypothetical protein